MANSENAPDGSDAHIPLVLIDPAIEITPAPIFSGEMPTIFVGIVDKAYTDAMWNNHALRIAKLFKFDSNQCIHFQAFPGRQENQIDSALLETRVVESIELINKVKPVQLRIVGLGIHGSFAVVQALESIIRAWDAPFDNKKVQFIALGDSLYGDYFKFCKNVCLKRLCCGVQFYSTMDYNEHGCLDLDRQFVQDFVLRHLQG